MSDALQDLYQSIILDHNKRPRNYGKLAAFTHSAEGFNPLCGDKVAVFLMLESSRIRAIGFESASCAICKASASIMTGLLGDQSLPDAKEISGHVHTLLSPDKNITLDLDTHDEMAALAGVRQFPARIKCALLPWKTFQNALDVPNVEHGISNPSP